MLQPFRVCREVPSVLANFVRSKIVLPSDAAAESLPDRLHRWNKDNKLLFGGILRPDKPRKQQNTRRNKRGGKENPATSVQCADASSAVAFDKTKSKSRKTPKNPFKNDRRSSLDEVRTQIAKMKTLNAGLLASKPNPFLSIITRNLRSFPLLSGSQKTTAEPKTDVVDDGKVILLRGPVQGETKQFPAVTTILGDTMSEQAKAALEKWKQDKIAELGQKGFEVFQKAQLDAGIKFHNAIETFLLESKQPALTKEIEGVWNSCAEVIKLISKPRAIESHVSHPILKYRGIIDCIAFFENKPTLIEWKKSDKPKHSLTSTFDNPIQMAAYFGAVSHDPNYKHLKVRDALLVISYTDGSKADYFHLSTEEMRKHWGAWLTRYENFLEIKGSDPTALMKGGKRMFAEEVQNL